MLLTQDILNVKNIHRTYKCSTVKYVYCGKNVLTEDVILNNAHGFNHIFQKMLSK